MSKTALDIIVNCYQCGIINVQYNKGCFRRKILEDLEKDGWKEILGKGYMCSSCFKRWEKRFIEENRKFIHKPL